MASLHSMASLGWKHMVETYYIIYIYMGVSGNVGDTVQSAQVADVRQDLG